MGQFDNFVKNGSQIVPGEGARPSVVRTPQGRERVIPREIVASGPNGEPVDLNQDSTKTQGGKPNANSKSVSPIQMALVASSNRKASEVAAAGSVYREKTRARSRSQREGLATTSMRMVNGEAVDTAEVTTPKANPISRLFAKGKDRRPAARPVGPITEGMAKGPFVAPEDAAVAMDPTKATRESKYAADASTEAKRLDLLRGEDEFNARESATGSTTRSLNGVTYDVADRRAEVMAAPANTFGTYQSDLESAASANDVIPKSPYTKKAVDPEDQEDYRPSSIIPTDLTKLDEGDEDRAQIDDSGRAVGDSDLTTDAPVKAPTLNTAAKEAGELTSDEKESVKIITPEDKSENKKLTTREKEVLENEQKLQNAGLADSRRERHLKGKRGDRFDKDEKRLTDSKPSETSYSGPRQFKPVSFPGLAPTAVVEGDIPERAYERVAKTDKKTGKTTYSEGSELDPLHNDPNTILSTTMREVPAEGPVPGGMLPTEGRPADTFKKGESFNTSIPLEAMNTDYDEGLTTEQIDKKNKAQVKNRIPSGARGTSAYDPNETMAKGNSGRTEESKVTDLSRLQERNAKLGSTQTHSPEVVKTAQRLGIVSGLTADEVNASDPVFHQSEHMTKAFVMHESGNADNPAAVEAYVGGNPLEANRRMNTVYSAFDSRKRFRDTSKPGTGYSYGFDHKEGAGKVNDTDYFKTKNGQEVPMSNTMHPEHPLANGKVMEGSAVPFKGLVKDEDGTDFHTKELHHGWAPYSRNGKRVFEYHNIGPDSIHDADVLEGAINGGVTVPALQRGLNKGKDTGVEVAGQSVTAAPKAPIKGAVSSDNIPEFNPLAVKYPRVASGDTGEGTPIPDTRALKAVKYHENHVASGINKVGCKYCTSKASKASRDGSAAAAQSIGDQIITSGVTVANAAKLGAPLPKGGVGRRNIGEPLEAGGREGLSDAEKETKNSPSLRRDDSKILVPTSPATTPEGMPKKAKSSPANTLEGRMIAEPGIHGSMEEISAAHKSGGISYDEARELAVSAGHMGRLVKSQFEPGGEQHGSLAEITEAKRGGHITSDEALDLAQDAGHLPKDKAQ